jgi:hypothetical protein
MTDSPTYVVQLADGTSTTVDGHAQTPVPVVIVGGAAPGPTGPLTAPLNCAGYAVTNFDNGHTTSDVALVSNASTAVLAVVLGGLVASHKYLCTLGARVYIYTDADHAVGGAVDVVIGVSITTDGSSVAACTLSGAAIPDTSNLPTGIAGATATVAGSAGGFTISATRKAGTNCHARAKWWVNTFEDVTA